MVSNLPPEGSVGWWQGSNGKWYPPDQTPEALRYGQKPEQPKDESQAFAEGGDTDAPGLQDRLKQATGCGLGFWALMALPLVLLVLLLLVNSGDGGIEVTAVMDEVRATSSSIVTIRYTLTNDSNEGGSVDCTAQVDNPVGSGFATLTGYLGPNETKTYTNEIVVTNNAAMETRSASIDCD